MIADYFYQRPRLLILSLMSIVAVGVSSLIVMPRLEDPPLRQRVGVITTVYPGATAEQVEATITQPIENRLASIGEIARVRSTTRSESVNVVIELADSVNDVDRVWSKVREAMLDMQPKLPQGTETSTLDIFPLRAYATIIAVQATSSAPSTDWVELTEQADELKSSILALPATERVDVFGAPEFEILVQLTPEAIVSSWLTPGSVAQTLAMEHGPRAQGAFTASQQTQWVGVRDTADPLPLISDTQFRSPRSGQLVRLGDVATVEQTIRHPRTSKAVIDGEPSIVLGVLVQQTERLDRWDDQLQKVLAEFNNNEANVVSAQPIFSQRVHIDQRMQSLLTNLAISTTLVVLVVLLMMGWRASLVVATSLPLAASLVLGGLRLLEIPIHQMSVTGLIVSLGLLIDNAIVIVEEIRSRILHGHSTRVAIAQSIRHLTLPLLGSTITTALAFLPIALMTGPSGEFVGSMAVSVILAISASLLLALTIIPAMFGVLRITPRHQTAFSVGIRIHALERLYRRSLQLVFRFPEIGLLISVILPLLGFFGARKLDRQFFPASDRSQIQIEIENDAGATLASVEQSSTQIQELLSADDRVLHQSWFFGESAPTFYYNVVPRRRNTSFYAQAFIDIDSNLDQVAFVRQLQDRFDREITNGRVIVRRLEQGPPFDAPVEVRISGEQLSTLQDAGEKVRQLLMACNHVTQTRSDLNDSIDQWKWTPDVALERDDHLSEDEISKFIYMNLDGVSGGETFTSGRRVPIRVTTKLTPERELAELAALPIVTPTSVETVAAERANRSSDQRPTVPRLLDLGTFELKLEAAAIIRIDGERVNEVKAYVQAGILPSTVVNEFRSRLEKDPIDLPDGYRLEFGGEAEEREHAVAKLAANATVLFSLMAVTLVAIFHSFRAAFIIATVGGLTVGLGVLALDLFEYPFGFMAIVGTMGLVGIAINDSIVVLASIRAAEQGIHRDPAALAELVSGCTRHILATTITTVVGFLPLVIFGGDFWPPLAITICAGVSGATLLALYYVPAMYCLLKR